MSPFTLQKFLVLFLHFGTSALCSLYYLPTLKAQLKQNLSRTPFRMVPSRGEIRPSSPKDHHSSLLLWWRVSLSANLFCVEHVNTGPLHHLVTGPA